MSNVHVISDLFLGFNESSISEEILPPDTDLVIFNGNIGMHIKRSFLYMETMCKLYPDVQFVVNLGARELYSSYDKVVNEISNSIMVRKDNNATWPKNLHFDNKPMIITLRDGTQVDVLCLYGFPHIHSYQGSWEDTFWYKNHCKDIVYGLDQIEDHIPKNTSRVLHGAIPIFVTVEDINKLHEKEWKIAQSWEIKPSVIKILVTHINPFIDSRCNNCKVSPYNIHLQTGYWVGSDTEVSNVGFLGGKLYSNPGRGTEARSRIFKI